MSKYLLYEESVKMFLDIYLYVTVPLAYCNELSSAGAPNAGYLDS
ncbi:MAG: hypothetical protein V8Q77_03015 [Bacilli bacterium]